MASVYHLLSRQIPAHIQQQYPIFCKFIEYYYRWLQTRGFVSLADVTNTGSTSFAEERATIVLIDENNEERRIGLIIPSLAVGETKQINSIVTADVVNVKDFRIEAR